MNDIRLSIGLPKKQQQQQQPTKKRFTAAALIHQKQQLEQQQQQQLQQQEDDDENQHHETHHIFRIESPKGKRNNGAWLCGSIGGGCGSGRLITIIVLFVFTFAWLLTLTLLHVFSTTTTTTSVVSAIAPVIERNARDTLKFEVPFTLQLSDNNSRTMTLPLQNLTFERLIRYDVCCAHQAYFVCRSVLKNIGVEAYLTSEKNAVILLIHPDMVGARCVIMWTERAI
jgi:hypothetical protein